MITYGGVPLLLEDPDGMIATFQAAFQEMIRDGAFCSEPAAVKSINNVTQQTGPGTPGVGLPVFNYPELPPPRLNSIIWPSGGCRWSRAYFLINGTQKNAITSNSNKQNTLLIGDELGGAGQVMSFQMDWLTPRSISQYLGDNNFDGQLWVLPLVDSRYFAFVSNANDLAASVTSSTSWASLISSVTPITAAAVDSAYLNPDWIEFARSFENAGVGLDAIAASVGMRIVAGANLTMNTPYSDASICKANLALPGAIIAGGNFSGPIVQVPGNVNVVFRKFKDGVAQCDGSVKSYTGLGQPPASIGNVTFENSGSQYIFSSCFADYTGITADPPNNDTKLQVLATKAATDYYAWQSYQYDITFAGLVNWTPTGFDNFVEWRFGARRPDGTYQGYTRAVSMPPNFFAEQQLSQDPNLNIISSWTILAKYDKTDNSNTDPWAVNTSAKVKVYSGTPGSETYAGYTIHAFNKFSDIADGSFFLLSLDCDGWYVSTLISKGIATDIEFHMSGAALNYNDANTAGHHSIDNHYGGTLPAGTITITNPMNNSLPSGGRGWATLVSYTSSNGNATYAIRAVNPTDWTGFTAGAIQFLGHDTSGNMIWYNIKNCSS